MMTATPKVSIIMTTFNRAAFIMESIESVLWQTYQNWELIIVDDGSEDNTATLVSQIKDERIRFYAAGKIGLGIKLKNIGIEKANGELIAFIDSDDLWAPEKLAKQIAVLQHYPDAGFSITGGYNFRNKNEPLEYFYKEREGVKYGDIFFSFFRSEASIFPQTLLFGKQCLPVIDQYIKTNPYSDVEFLLGLALHFKAVILYEPLLYRRLHDESFSSMNWQKGYEEGIEMINRYRKNKKLPGSIATDALFRLYINFGEGYYRRKNRAGAIGSFLKAWKNKPFSMVPFKKTAKVILGFKQH